MTKQQRAEAKLRKLNRNETIVALYTTGETVKQIMIQAEVGEATIFSVLKKAGIELKANKHFTEAAISHAMELYKDPANTIRHILTTTGIRSEQTLYRYLTERNIPRRKTDLHYCKSVFFNTIGTLVIMVIFE